MFFESIRIWNWAFLSRQIFINRMYFPTWNVVDIQEKLEKHKRTNIMYFLSFLNILKELRFPKSSGNFRRKWQLVIVQFTIEDVSQIWGGISSKSQNCSKLKSSINGSLMLDWVLLNPDIFPIFTKSLKIASLSSTWLYYALEVMAHEASPSE